MTVHHHEREILKDENNAQGMFTPPRALRPLKKTLERLENNVMLAENDYIKAVNVSYQNDLKLPPSYCTAKIGFKKQVWQNKFYLLTIVKLLYFQKGNY